MERKNARELDRWITDDARDYGAADAPDPAPIIECPARPPHRVAPRGPNGERIDTSYVNVGRRFPRRTPDPAAQEAAERNALQTRRDAIAQYLLSLSENDARAMLGDIAICIDRLKAVPESEGFARDLAEQLLDIIDGAL